MNKLIFLLLLFLVVYVQNSPCSEKASIQEEDSEECSGLKTSDDSKYNCLYDPSSNACKEKTCEDLPDDECDSFISNDKTKLCMGDDEGKCKLMSCSDMKIDECTLFMIEGEKQCLPNSDNSKCEFLGCEDFKSNCEQFTLNEESKCILKSDNSGCTLSKCSDMDITNCGEFIPISNDIKCTAVGDTCQIGQKECSDYGVDECPQEVTSEYNCFPDLDKKMCIAKKCEDLASTECDKYKSSDDTKKCFPEGEKCRIKACEDLTVNECESMVFDDNAYKCIVDNNKCKFSSCYDSAGTCESFIPNIPISYCKEDSSDGGCVLFLKKCEELPNDLCDLYNEELKKGGLIPDEICVQGEDKCKLEYVEDDEDDEGGFDSLDSEQILVLILVGVALLVLILLLFCLYA